MILRGDLWDKFKNEGLGPDVMPPGGGSIGSRSGLPVATGMRGQEDVGCTTGPPSIGPTPEDLPHVSLEVILVPVGLREDPGTMSARVS